MRLKGISINVRTKQVLHTVFDVSDDILKQRQIRLKKERLEREVKETRKRQARMRLRQARATLSHKSDLTEIAQVLQDLIERVQELEVLVDDELAEAQGAID